VYYILNKFEENIPDGGLDVCARSIVEVIYYTIQKSFRSCEVIVLPFWETGRLTCIGEGKEGQPR
jgi:hypothetical protein